METCESIPNMRRQFRTGSTIRLQFEEKAYEVFGFSLDAYFVVIAGSSLPRSRSCISASMR
eukprot:scaffold44591_cov54-Attheya_sp.AAC.5